MDVPHGRAPDRAGWGHHEGCGFGGRQRGRNKRRGHQQQDDESFHAGHSTARVRSERVFLNEFNIRRAAA